MGGWRGRGEGVREEGGGGLGPNTRNLVRAASCGFGYLKVLAGLYLSSEDRVLHPTPHNTATNVNMSVSGHAPRDETNIFLFQNFLECWSF